MSAMDTIIEVSGLSRRFGIPGVAELIAPQK